MVMTNMKLRTLDHFTGIDHFMGLLMGLVMLLGIGLSVIGLCAILSCLNLRDLIAWGTITQAALFVIWNLGFACHQRMGVVTIRPFECPCKYVTEHPLLEWYHKCKCLSFTLNGKE